MTDKAIRKVARRIRKQEDSSLLKAGCHPTPGEPITSSHLNWMLREIERGHVTGAKAHLWLGFVIGTLHGWFRLDRAGDFLAEVDGKYVRRRLPRRIAVGLRIDRSLKRSKR